MRKEIFREVIKKKEKDALMVLKLSGELEYELPIRASPSGRRSHIKEKKRPTIAKVS